MDVPEERYQDHNMTKLFKHFAFLCKISIHREVLNDDLNRYLLDKF